MMDHGLSNYGKKTTTEDTCSRTCTKRASEDARPHRGSSVGRHPRLIEQARQQAARTVNSAMVGLYWQNGKRIREDMLHEQRAEYGEQIVQTVSAQLTLEYGRGFGRRNLF